MRLDAREASTYALKESIVDVGGSTSELVAPYNNAMEDFNPYAAPQHDLRLNIVADEFYDSVWRDHELLVMRKDAVLPARCVRCNAPAEERLKIRWLGWSRPTSAKIELGVCDRHLRRMRVAVTITWLLFLFGLGMAFIGMPYRLQFGPGNPLAVKLLSSSAIIMFAAVVNQWLFTSPPVRLHKINQDYIWLKKVCPSYLAQLPPYPR